MVNCKHCSEELEPESKFCGTCGHKVEPIVQEPPEPLKPTLPEAAESLENEKIDCPYCGKTIKLMAKKCRYCGQVLSLEDINQQDRKLGIFLEKEKKKCPMCAENINLLSRECELCGEKFDPAEVARQIEARRSKLLKLRSDLLKGVCPRCGKPGMYADYTESYWCPNCKKYAPLTWPETC